MADLNSVLQAFAGREAQASQHAIDLNSLLSTEVEIRNQARDLVTTDANGKTPEMVRQEGIAALQAQERTIGISKALGLSNDLTTDMQYKLAMDQRQAIEVARQQGAKINEMESVGLTDNPIEYLLNQWMLPDEYAKYDGAVNAQKQSAMAIQDLQASTANASRTSTLIAESITKATIADQLKASEASIQQQKLKYTMDNLQAARQYTKDLFALDGQKLERAKDIYQLHSQAEQQAYMREARDAARADRKAKLDAELKADNDIKVEQESALKAINRSRAKRGEAPYGMDIFMKGGLASKTGTEVGKQINKDWEAGVNLEYGAPVRMGTATETAKLLATNPIQKISDQHEVVAKTVTAEYAKAASVPGRKAEEIEQLTEKAILQRKQDWEAGAGGDQNPLKPLPVQALDMQKAVAANPAWQAYRKVVTADGDLNTKDLGTKMKKLLQERIVTPEQVGSLLSAIGHTSAEFNNVNTDLMYLTGTKQEHLVVPMVIGRTKAQEMAFAAGSGLLGMSPWMAAPSANVPPILQPSGLGAAFPIKTPGKPIAGFSKLAIAQAAAGGTLLALGAESEERIDLMAPTSELVKKAYKMLGEDMPGTNAK